MNVKVQNTLLMVVFFAIFLYIGTDSIDKAMKVSWILLLAVISLTLIIVGTLSVIEYKAKIVLLFGKLLSNILIWLFAFLVVFILAKFEFPIIFLVIVFFGIPIKWILTKINV